MSVFVGELMNNIGTCFSHEAWVACLKVIIDKLEAHDSSNIFIESGNMDNTGGEL